LSEHDSFIEEVSEEVRRDRLFGFFKKYVWAFALLVILIVGGAAYNEYAKAKTETAAEAVGEALLDAQEAATSAAFAPIANTNAPAAVLAKMEQAAALHGEGQTQAAADVLDTIASGADVPSLYRDLALLKIVMINAKNMDANALQDALDTLTTPNAPFRLLAIEQRAIISLENGDTEAARKDLAEILLDPDATQGLRNRAQELTIAMGGGNLAPASDG